MDQPTECPRACVARSERETHTVVDKVRDVPLVGGVHRVYVFYVVQVEQVRGALPVVQVPPLLRLVRRDDLTGEGDSGE